MILIEDVLISDQLVRKNFRCHLEKCKGACCYEGDYGAPLDTTEIESLSTIYRQIKDLLPSENRECIASSGLYTFYKESDHYGTQLMPDRSCVFMIHDQSGMARCSIEAGHQKGLTHHHKPMSCQLYPVRVSKNEKTGFMALNYDEWDICSAACQLGDEEKMPLYKFVKTALIRKFGQPFYDQLDAFATQYPE